MNDMTPFQGLEVGYDIPALPGMAEGEIQTPCLVLDLDALERNIKKMGDYAKAHGMRHRVHGKMHKSVDVAKLQVELGGACGVCCQKVSEAEVFARGGIKDVLVSNQVRDPAKIDRLARMPKLGARTICCVDDVANVADLSAAAQKHGTEIECLVEIDCGAGRCGVTTTPEVVEIAKAIDAAPGLKFAGIQAYQGAMQHMDSYDDRKAKIDIAVAMVKDAVDTLKEEGLDCDIVGGGGTGSYYFESHLGRLQRASVRLLRLHGCRLRPHPRQGRQPHRPGRVGERAVHPDERDEPCQADKAIVDAGLKAQSVDSGLPVIFGRTDVEYVKCSDEHGVVADPDRAFSK
jgi:3-hydroxy-D-aspartate aldolase